jgi:acetyl-CoA carboxylase carboxyltransferase component
MTARERVEYLLDNIENAIEIGALAGYECMPNMEDA